MEKYVAVVMALVPVTVRGAGGSTEDRHPLASDPVVDTHGITGAFPGTRGLADVDFQPFPAGCMPSWVRAGGSTLIRALAAPPRAGFAWGGSGPSTPGVHRKK
ncbi:hypothetical protein [Nocardiopsis alkaliphila]|uniref:hypothetical protein n=1 Tax=Nocardiopsis alkaliphila TaxID=225762 RepID=UPI001268EE69|nr:hypothetical protein [Nocardiopsis alkaliphila]